MNKRNRVGKDHPLFKDGKSKDSNGYVVLQSKIYGDNANKREHRVVMESFLNRPLNKDEIVHHKNGVRDDNRIENLEVMSREDHNREHGKGEELICSNCGDKRWYGIALQKSLVLPYLCRKCYPKNRWKEKHPIAKLTYSQAMEIRKRRSDGEKGKDLAKEFGVSVSTICDIYKRRKYNEM